MKNADQWQPTKYAFDRRGRLKASSDPKQVFVGSKLKANITAQYFARYLPQFVRGDLLDLGCGKVPLYLVYKDLVSSTTCVDWQDNPFLDHALDLSQALPFDDNSFDTIILSDVLEHVPQPETTIAEMHRILRPGGRVLITVPFYYWLHDVPHDHYRYTEYALRRFAELLDFDVVALEATGGAVEVITDVIAKNLVFHVKRLGVPIARALQDMNLLLLQTRWGQRLKEKTARLFPIEYFVVFQKRDCPH